MLNLILSIALFMGTTLAEEAEANVPPLNKKISQYSLEDLNAMGIWGRIKVNDWTLEYITLAFTAIFIVCFKIGDIYNNRLVVKFLDGVKDTMESNFFQYGTSKDDLYIKDNAENYSSYATGRTNIARVRMDFKLRPRHNIFVWFLEGVMSFFTEAVQKPIDKVDIVITPSVAYDNFIVGIVSKLGMNIFRKFNYFLSLTKTQDSPNLPESFVFMSEGNEFQEKVMTNELAESLTLQSADYIRYISFTDQATERPEKPEGFAPFRRVIVSLKLSSSKDDLKQISNTLENIFGIIDDLASKKITFKADSLKKVAKTREVELAKVVKAEELAKQEEQAEEQARLKKEERDRVRNLSTEEQIKLEKKEMEKKQKKAQKKQKVRMN